MGIEFFNCDRCNLEMNDCYGGFIWWTCAGCDDTFCDNCVVGQWLTCGCSDQIYCESCLKSGETCSCGEFGCYGCQEHTGIHNPGCPQRPPHEFLFVTPSQPDTATPTSQNIAAVLQQLPSVEEDDFAILERTDEASKGVSFSYLQARPHLMPQYEGMFLIEHRDGVAGRHYGGHIEAERVSAVFESYLTGDHAWRDMLVWRDITFKFEELRAQLPPEESAASFFPDGEWEEGLQTKEQRDDAFWKEWDQEKPS